MPSLPKHLENLFPHEDLFGALVGYELESYEEGKVRTSLKIEKKHLSPSGKVHGGVISSFVDWSMGAAVFTTIKPGMLCSTIEFKINYLSGVQLGEKIFADSKIKFRGRSHAVIECHVFREEGKDVAVALGTFNIYLAGK
ncbi:MAG: PaaI family thioesterase [Deltaproteobacteria bacterium]|nr:PaaI family thioesterase [Deltaproteobacteria bacterium]